MTSESLGKGIRGIVFDAVGTLINPSPPVADVYLAAAARQNVVLDRAEVRSRFRRHFRNDEIDETLGPMVTDDEIELRRWRRIVANVLPELPDPERGFAELWDHFARPDAWRCDPDAGPTLDALAKSGVPHCVASNFDSRLRGVVAGLPELAGLAGSLVISSEVGFRKPHSAFYLAACDRLGLPPSAVLCVGDDAENDVLGPSRAGLRGVLIDRSSALPAVAGVHRLSRLSELLGVSTSER